MDTSTFTHFCRAGHGGILARLAPTGVILIPTAVNDEIEQGRHRHTGIPSLSSIAWAQVAVLTEDEEDTMIDVLSDMGGSGRRHLGESAVIACAFHRGLTAVLDERDAVEQASIRDVVVRDTMWIVIEAYTHLFRRDRARTAAVVDDLLATGMYLPVDSGESLLTWAWEEGLLP